MADHDGVANIGGLNPKIQSQSLMDSRAPSSTDRELDFVVVASSLQTFQGMSGLTMKKQLYNLQAST